MFEGINGTWLDGAFFNVLRYVDGMHIFFMGQVRIVAMICFALSLGISCVKMLMGAMELNKVLTQAFMSIATYFIMIFLFPIIMINVQKVISELAYEAVFSQGFTLSLERKYGKAKDFYAYLNEIGSDKNGVTIWAVKENNDSSQNSLELHITHKETGLISINKIFLMVLSTFKALWKSLNIKGLVDFFIHFPDLLMVIIIGLAYLWALSVAIVQYVMIIVQYVFLYGMGVLFIPMMLWEGSKHAFEKLCGSIFNVGVKLLVVQTTLYLAVMINIDMLKNMFILSKGNTDFMQGIEFYLSIAFMVIFVKLFVDQAPAIADFLCGGQPSLSFGSFVSAAASGLAAGGAALGAGAMLAKGVGTAGLSAAGALGAAGGVASNASKSVKAQGGGIGDRFKAGLKSFGKSIGQSAKQGGANMLDRGIDAVTKTPQMLRGAGQLMKNGISPGSGASGSTGGGTGSGTGGKSGGLLMQSNNISERVKGMGELYRENRANDPQYSGLKGRFKAIKNSIKEFHDANKKFAPG
jgi:uncharacterized membrane protein YgcG